MMYWFSPSSVLPARFSLLAVRMVVASSSRLIWNPDRRRGSASMRICSERPPTTKPMPVLGISSMRCSTSSAKARRAASSTSRDQKVSVTMGTSSMLLGLTMGSETPGGIRSRLEASLS
jgi:hypothetical protein